MTMDFSRKYQILGAILILLHLVGAIGCMLEFARQWMLDLTPFNLLLSALLLIYSHQESRSKLYLFLLITWFLGFLVEAIGVSTSWPFGSYTYGETLGLKLFDVPLVIGVNWFILSYIFGNLVSPYIKLPKALQIILAATLMTSIDILIEPIAVSLDYWSWEGNSIPFKNYLGWFLVSLLMQAIYHGFHFRSSNPLAVFLLISQLIFFGLLIFLYIN